MMTEEIEYSLSKIYDAAERLLDIIRRTEVTVVAFNGEMGAGKTTLISALCSLMQVEDIPSSPTFAIVNVYRTQSGETVNHFDFYRARRIEEAFDIGFEEYVDSGQLCLVEWPDIVRSFLPENTLEVSISVVKENTRKLCLSL